MGSRAVGGTGLTARLRTQVPDVRVILSWLKPLDGGPNEIRAVDGLRAIAALSVLFYHAVDSDPHAFGIDWKPRWWYPFFGKTGVDLFFVLSGFLLFLPFARAILDARPLPSTRRFFSRRAQRIVPAYVACMAILVVFQWQLYDNPQGALDVGAHLLFIHDAIPPFDHAINGVFWTLAIEGQFYLLLPFASALLARVVGGRRSALRLTFAVCMYIVVMLLLRETAAVLAGPMRAAQGPDYAVPQVFVLALFGVQGKFFEVFGLGMLCAVVYIVVHERRTEPRRATYLVGGVLFIAGLATLYALCKAFALFVLFPTIEYTQLQATDVPALLTPSFLGLGYAALLLGVLLGGRIIRAPFELGPLRFLGIISYSIYLWHAPAIWGLLPFTTALTVWQRAAVGLVLAYFSYTLVEKPFLRRRSSQRAKPAPTPAAAEPDIEVSVAGAASMR